VFAAVLSAGLLAAAPAPTPPVVEALAPIVYLHPEERYLPTSADAFIALSELKWNHDGGCPDERLAPLAKIVPASLARRDGRYDARKAAPAYRRCGRSGRTYAPADFTRPLDDRNATGAEGFFMRYTGSASGVAAGPWPVDYEYVPGRYVAYWLFYAQSQPVKVGEGVIQRVVSSRWLDTLGTHQGDWEHVTIRLSGDEPVEMAFYSHGSPRVVPWSAVEKDAGRPVVYSAQGSHASYPAPSSERGERRCFRNLGCIVDPTGRGRRWDTRLQLGDVRAKPWYGYGGAWGALGSWYRAEGVAGRRRETAGPLGPSLWKTEVAPAAWR
jgi:hypothetical protein